MRIPAPLRLFRGAEGTLVTSFGLSIVQSALLVPIAALTRHLFDSLIPAGRTSEILLVGLLILALYLASAAVGLVTRYIVQRTVKRAIARFRSGILAELVVLPQAYFDGMEAGRLHSTVVQDTERVDCMASALASDLLPSGVVAVALSLTLLYLNAFLFLVLIAVVPLVTVAAKLLGRQVRVYGLRWQDAFDTFSSRTLLTLRALPLVRIHGAEELVLAERTSEIDELSRTGLDMTWRATAYSIVQGTIATAAGVAVLVVGGAAVARHQMSMGDLLSFYAVVALLLRQVGPMVNSVPVILIGRNSLKRLDELTATVPSAPYTGGSRHAFGGWLALDDVSFGYTEDVPVLRGVTLGVAPGEQVAIMGPNGAGKSTLLGLVLGLYRPTSGMLRADGVPYDELDISDLRTQTGVVLQDPILLPGTVRENIAFGRPGATLEEVQRAAALATADEVITSLPDGYDTPVGDDGGLLSGGQRQRIAIARALMGAPALVLLDEPTTHLDDRTIGRLLDNLRHLPGAPAVVVITHDAEVAAHADRVYRLRDGTIAGVPELVLAVND